MGIVYLSFILTTAYFALQLITTPYSFYDSNDTDAFSLIAFPSDESETREHFNTVTPSLQKKKSTIKMIRTKIELPTLSSLFVKSHRIDHSYQLVVFLLPDNEAEFPVLQYRSDWESQFDSFVRTQFSQNKWRDPPKIEKVLNETSDEYTSFIRNSENNGGFSYVYGKNICYNTKNNRYIFLTKDSSLSVFTLGPAFRYGWRFNNIRQSASNMSALWVTDEVYITQPWTERHIYHFIESINFLWLKLQRINEFPVLKQLWLPRFFPSIDYSWNRDYLSALSGVFGTGYNLTIMDGPTIKSISPLSSPFVCFRRAMLLDRSHYNGDGGHLNGWISADLVRAVMYKYSNIFVKQPIRDNDIRLNIVQRSGMRRFVNPERIIRHVNMRYGEKVLATVKYANVSFAKQVELFMKSDIVLAPHGAGLTNAMFMRPYTVLLEANPPFFLEPTFMNLAGIIRVRYASINTFNETYMSEKVKRGSEAGDRVYQKGQHIARRRFFLRALIDPSITNVIATIDNAVEWIQSYFFKREEREFHYLFLYVYYESLYTL